MNDEFKKGLLLWPLLLTLLAIAHSTIGAATGTQSDAIWGQVAAATFLFLFSATFLGLPFWQSARRQRALTELAAFYSQARYLETINRAAAARRLWPDWEGPTLIAGMAELLLWRVDAARLSFERLHSIAVEPAAERQMFVLALIAAELAGDAELARERVVRARLTETVLTLPNLIRAARERDHARVLSLASTMTVPREFEPLVAVLCAWASEKTAPLPIDKIALLGETGLDQVEKIWPDLADFIKRSPPV